MPETELLERFIVRERQFQLLWEDIADSKLDKIDQHFLIIGQRGMGKTTLMLKTAYEIRRDPKLKDWLIPVLFPEELFGVTDLTGLWLALAEVLDQDFPGLFDELQALLHKHDESVLLEAIRRRLNQPKRKLVIFLDNFGDLLDRLNEIEVHRLREVLMNARDLRLIAASARVIDHTYRYNKPFFDFFNTIHLPELTKEESKTLMQELADQAGKRDVFDALIAKHPGRIEAIRRLTGGVPRLLLLLFSSLIEEGDTELMDDLETILDQASPYYKHRVEDLQSQQRSIFHHVAMAWDAVSTSEIASSTRLESKKVSAQLQQMADGGILERVETGGKNHLYRLQERFFNIWYLMRMAGNRGAERMKWLVAFFETWLEGGALKQKLENLATEFRADGNIEYAIGIETLLEKQLKQQFEVQKSKPTLTSPELLPYNLRLRNAYQWGDLLKIYDELKRRGIPPDVVTFTTLIKRAPTWEEAIWALQEMQRLEISGDDVTFNTLIDHAPTWDEAIWALEEMQRLEVNPDVVTFNTIIGHAPTWDEAIWALEEMQRLEISPEVVTFNILIKQAPTRNEALWALEEMQRLDVSPDVVTFTMLIKQAPTWHDAIWALQEMQRFEVSPNVVTFTILIDHAPTWKEAIWALQEMQRLEVSPDVVTFTILIDHAPNWQEAIWALLEMQRLEVSPNVVTFNTLIRRAPTWQEAIWAMDEMQRFGAIPDAVTFNTIWVEAESHADFFRALETFKHTWNLHWNSPFGYKGGRQEVCLAIIHLWDNNFLVAQELAMAYFEENAPFGQHMLYQEFYLLELLIRFQTHECYSLFETSPHRLKDVFKPIWYALLKLMGEKGQKEYLRMGPELEETVSEIVDFVEKMRIKYPH